MFEQDRFIVRLQPPEPSGIRKIIITAGDRVDLLAQLKKIRPLAELHTSFTELRFAGCT